MVVSSLPLPLATLMSNSGLYIQGIFSYSYHCILQPSCTVSLYYTIYSPNLSFGLEQKNRDQPLQQISRSTSTVECVTGCEYPNRIDLTTLESSIFVCMLPSHRSKSTGSSSYFFSTFQFLHYLHFSFWPRFQQEELEVYKHT